MKLQKQKNKEIGDKIYYKWVLTLPPKIIEKISWKEGDVLNITYFSKDRIVIQRATFGGGQ